MLKKSTFAMRIGIIFFVCTLMFGYYNLFVVGNRILGTICCAIGIIGGSIYWIYCKEVSYSVDLKCDKYISLSVLEKEKLKNVFAKESTRGKIFENEEILGVYRYNYYPFENNMTRFSGYLVETSKGWYYAFESSFLDNETARKFLEFSNDDEMFLDIFDERAVIQFTKINTLIETVKSIYATRITSVRICINRKNYKQLVNGSQIKQLCRGKFRGFWVMEPFYMPLKDFEKLIQIKN